jgi:WD40 repeat protein
MSTLAERLLPMWLLARVLGTLVLASATTSAGVELERGKDVLVTAAISTSSGSVWATETDRTIGRWDWNSGRLLSRFDNRLVNVTRLAVSTGGTWIAVAGMSEDGHEVRIHATETGELIARLPGQARASWLAEGCLATWTLESDAQIWEFRGQKFHQDASISQPPGMRLLDLVPIDHGRILIACGRKEGDDHQVELMTFDLASRRIQTRRPCEARGQLTLRVAPQAGLAFVCGTATVVEVFRTDTLQQIARVDAAGKLTAVTAATLSADGQTIAIGGPRIWTLELATGQWRRMADPTETSDSNPGSNVETVEKSPSLLTGLGNYPIALDLTSNGTCVAVYGGRRVATWKSVNGVLIRRFDLDLAAPR